MRIKYTFEKLNIIMAYAFSMLSFSILHSTTATFVLIFILGVSLTLISIGCYNGDYSVSPVYARPQVSPNGPTLNDPNLTLQTVFQGLKSPTAMAFLEQNDVLVLEKGQGTVQRIINGEMLPEPLVQVDVTSKDERGLLGVAIAPDDEDDGNATMATIE